MDTELSSLYATLRGIEILHASIAQASTKPQPFTNAVLNTHDLPVLSYIRDADPLEAGLFFYPGSQKQDQKDQQQSQQQHQQQAPVHEMTAEEQYALLNPRGPEIKPHQPPTPLRRPVPAGGKAGQDDYDAKVLLLAAQKLLDNYHKAPRARKHIKALQKRNADAARLITDSENALSELEATALQRGLPINAPPPPTQKPQPAPQQQRTEAQTEEDKLNEIRHARRTEYASLQAELVRDDLDCFALEGLIRELHGERDVLMSPRKKQQQQQTLPPPVAAGGKRLGGAGPRVSSLARGGGVGTSALGTAASSRRSSALGNKASVPPPPPSLASSIRVARMPITPGRLGVGTGSALERSVGRPTPGGVGGRTPVAALHEEEEEEEEEGDVGDETVSPMPTVARGEVLGATSEEVPAETNGVEVPSPEEAEEEDATETKQGSTFTIPEATPELERISTNINNCLSDSLRFVHLLNPASSSSSLSGFVPTYEALHALAYPLEEGGYANVSVLSSLVGAEALSSSAGDGGGGGPDESVAETDAGSVLTTTSSTTAGGTMTNVDAPTPTSTAIAFVLLQLLGVPSDQTNANANAVEFAVLKAKADEWWDAQRSSFLSARESVLRLSSLSRSNNNAAAAAAAAAAAVGQASVKANVEKEGGLKGSELATKAVYALVAKRLLRIRRAGGGAAVGFA
ncbi:hypothetical protein CF319_g705 [Tilletia indica]|nr:hypothetical protein CF319_g705 [Tilletia indica]